MQLRNRLLTLLMAASAVAVLSVIGIIRVAFTKDEPEVPENESQTFPGLADAEAAVGYELAQPGWLPSGWSFQRAILSESYYPSARNRSLKYVMIQFTPLPLGCI